MSLAEKSFIRWFAGIFGTIASGLIIVSIAGIVKMSQINAVYNEQIDQNKEEVLELREYHKDDVALIRKSVDEIKADNKEMKNDIKEILKEIK